jgi:hypothetical protein
MISSLVTFFALREYGNEMLVKKYFSNKYLFHQKKIFSIVPATIAQTFVFKLGIFYLVHPAITIASG